MFNQTAYTINHDKAIAGMVADGEVNNTISKVNKSAQVLQYGRFVARAGDDGMNPLAADTTAANVLGVLRYEVNRAQGLQAAVAGVPSDRDGSVLTMGTVYVETIAAVTAGAPVFAVVAQNANTGKAAGAVGADATLAVAVTGATFAESAASGKLVKVSLKVGG